MTRTIALLGHPVAHSISPQFQQAALDALGIDARYEAWDVAPADLPFAVERLRAADVLGANVTVPHKEAIVRLVQRPDALVERIGAANTIVSRDGVLHATNTDVAGVQHALADAGVELRGTRVLLIGAGGAARAVVAAVRRGGAQHLTIANRTPDRATVLLALAGADLPASACPLDPEAPSFRTAIGAADIVVQSTTLGMRHGPDALRTPVPSTCFRPGQVAFDLVYVPELTPFLAAAQRAGARPVGGLAMLVHQGAEAFRLWTGFDPPIDVMTAAARSALATREA
ncbi:MAG: shikimate dehydrogenase [Dehalococcoidia bacterium]|nr:shikimate dehydrogenase [Dehalococcoidia bacterium]